MGTIQKRVGSRQTDFPIHRGQSGPAIPGCNGREKKTRLAPVESRSDFADGVIAYGGSWLGGETFVSFDKKVVTPLSELGENIS